MAEPIRVIVMIVVYPREVLAVLSGTRLLSIPLRPLRFTISGIDGASLRLCRSLGWPATFDAAEPGVTPSPRSRRTTT